MFFLFLKTITFVLCFAAAYCSEDTEVFQEKEQTEDYILCRGCGYDITSSKQIISKHSPAAISSYHDTVFNNSNTLIQLITTDIFMRFSVITVRNAECALVGEWEEQDFLFPGYRSKICMCPMCGGFLGWAFEPNQSDSYRYKPFSALVLPNLVSDNCKYFMWWWNCDCDDSHHYY